ncbi:MAG: type II toxin-antitoxin system PemK/MazF family toxin [Blastocatellia bacterium]|nr:type II toxin-antitoxin system PemK/MazF family toxin [Blastocatellia bacterium]
MQHGEIWWADLPTPTVSGPGFRRPVLVVQADSFNQSRIQTVIVAVITKNLNLAEAPGNILLSPRVSHLPVASVVNVSQLIALDKTLLTEYVSTLTSKKIKQIEAGLRLVLGL